MSAASCCPYLHYYHSAGFDHIALFGPCGYDGESFAVLAPDRCCSRMTPHGAWMPRPAEPPGSASRLLACVCALGNPRLGIYGRLVICWVLGIAGVLLVGAWLWSESGSPLWAAGLIPGSGLGVSWAQPSR